jgi:hypothetical protein
MPTCNEYKALASAVSEILQQLAALTRAQHEAFLRHDDAELMRLDRELETAVGEKERRIGAFRYHKKQHGCES